MRILNGSLALVAMTVSGLLPACQDDLSLGEVADGGASRDANAASARTDKDDGNAVDGPGDRASNDAGNAPGADGASSERGTDGTGGTDLVGGDGSTDSVGHEGGAGSVGHEGGAGSAGHEGGAGSAGHEGGAGSVGHEGGGSESCGDLPSGSREQRIRFARSTATSAAGCESEVQVRTCDDGAFSTWSGAFAEERCVTLEACAGKDERIKAEACGINRRGRLTQKCVNGQWTDTDHCVDPDVCVEGRIETEACGIANAGTRQTVCNQGQWTPGACSQNAVTQISAGIFHTCALLESGAFTCWGMDAEKRRPTESRLYKQAVTGVNWGCGLTAEGELSCWGTLARLNPAPTDVRFKKIGQSSDCAHGLDVDGRIRSWNCAETEPLKEGQYVDYTAGEGWFCGVQADGRARCVGEHNTVGVPTGELGPDGGKFVEAAAGCALRDDGIVLCLNDSRRLPMNTYRHLIPVQQMRYPNHVFLCAVTRPGTLVCDADAPFRTALPSGGHVRDFVAGDYHACTLRDTGDVECSSWYPTFSNGLPTLGGLSALVAGGGSVCWIEPNGRPACAGDLRYPLAAFAATQVAVGQAGACARNDDGLVTCWGGKGDLPLPTPYRKAHFSEIAVGDDVMAGILKDTDDAGAILMWDPIAPDSDGARALVAEQGPYTQLAMGGDTYCAKGSDSLTRCSRRWLPLPAPFGEANLSRVSVSSAAACGLDPDGMPQCRGSVSTPQGPLKQIAVNDRSADHFLNSKPEACGLRADGTVICPEDTSARSHLPPETLFEEIAMGDGFLCGLTTTDRTLRCAGFCDWGQARPSFGEPTE